MKTPPRPHFQPRLESLEERCTPSASPAVPFKETLTLAPAPGAGGEQYYQGHATHLGKLNAILYPDLTFVKTTASGDTVSGFVAFSTPTAGTITITGGTGRLAGVTGLADSVISTDPTTGATTVDVVGTLTFGAAPQPGAAREPGARAVPLRIEGGGFAEQGVPLFAGGTATHTVAGTASHLGKYSGGGKFELLSIDYATLTGTFRTAEAVQFVAANGDVLALNYGHSAPGTVTLYPTADGEVVAVFVADFTPAPGESTGRFAGVTGGSMTVVATSEPFSLVSAVPGYSATFNFTWSGEGTLELRKGQ